MGARPHRWQLAFSALVVAAGLLNMLRMQLPLNVIPSWDMPISYLFVAAFLVWGASMRSRLLPSPLRACAVASAGCMAAWMVVRCFKYNTLFFLPEWGRLTWYGYYPLQLALAVLLFAGCAHAAMGENRRHWRRVVVAVGMCALFLSVAVLTNDLHQRAFLFADGIPDENGAYSLGPVYWAVVSFIAVLLAASVAFLVKAARAARLGWRLIVPFAILAAAFAYLLAREGVIRPFLQQFGIEAPFFFPEACCIASLLVWEWLVRCRLIPSNDRYPELFAAMASPAMVTDADLAGVYATELPLEASRGQLLAALERPLMVDAGTELRGMPIRAGYVFWTEDVAELARTREQLEEVAGQLAERNEIIAAENELSERRERIAARTRVYADAEAPLAADIEAMRGEVARMQGAGAVSPDELLELAVRLAFVKRAMNLRLTGSGGRRVDAEDVRACLTEMMRCLKPASVRCAAASAAEGDVDVDGAIAALRVFSQVAGELHGRMHALLATVDAASDALGLVVEPRADAGELARELRRWGISANVEDGAVYARIGFDAAGGGV